MRGTGVEDGRVSGKGEGEQRLGQHGGGHSSCKKRRDRLSMLRIFEKARERQLLFHNRNDKTVKNDFDVLIRKRTCLVSIDSRCSFLCSPCTTFAQNARLLFLLATTQSWMGKRSMRIHSRGGQPKSSQNPETSGGHLQLVLNEKPERIPLHRFADHQSHSTVIPP